MKNGHVQDGTGQRHTHTHTNRVVGCLPRWGHGADGILEDLPSHALEELGSLNPQPRLANSCGLQGRSWRRGGGPHVHVQSERARQCRDSSLPVNKQVFVMQQRQTSSRGFRPGWPLVFLKMGVMGVGNWSRRQSLLLFPCISSAAIQPHCLEGRLSLALSSWL